MSSPARVAVIGCGIAGPTLAMFLKKKGYDPVIYERLDDVPSAGLSLMLQPNGMKVLKLLPDVFANLPGKQILNLSLVSETMHEELALSDIPTRMPERYGDDLGLRGVQREAFLRYLCECALKHGIPIKWGHMLVDLEDKGTEVEIHFANGVKEKASFVVGCDGLHSNTRICLFGKERPGFTGLVQTGGFSPTPEILLEKTAMVNFFGVGSHLITYPISDTLSVWAVTAGEEERKESWNAFDEETKEKFINGPISKWDFGAGELVKTTTKLIKYGLYDRPELKTWYKGRVVLLGDAAHPTTPHLGQGANQAFEDVYHLIRTLTKHLPDPNTDPSTEELKKAFEEYEGVRLVRTSELVKLAHERGNNRAEASPDAALQRDKFLKDKWNNSDDGWMEFDRIAREPYDTTSEI